MMNFDQSSGPRYRVLVFADGRHTASVGENDPIRARQVYEFAIDRFAESPINRRVEFYDGPDLIDVWSREDD